MEDALAKRSDTFTQDLSSLKQATKFRVFRAGCGAVVVRSNFFWVEGARVFCRKNERKKWMKGEQQVYFCLLLKIKLKYIW